MPTDVDLFDAALDKFKEDNPDSTIPELHAFEFGFDAAIAALRAQADTRPVAYYVAVKDEPALGHWFAEEPAGDGYICRPLVFGDTHPAPEAAQAGLSDTDLRYVQRVLESDAPQGDRQRARDLIVKARLTRASASASTVAEPKPHVGILITLRQAEALVELFGDHDCEMIVRELSAGAVKMDEGEPDSPAGLWAHCAEYPEEGCAYLGPTEVDDDLAMNGHQEAAQQQAETHLATSDPEGHRQAIADHAAEKQADPVGDECGAVLYLRL